MKKFLKYSSLGLILSALCFASPVSASVQSNTQFSLLLTVFIEKMEKIRAYLQETNETLDTINEFGELEVNYAAKMLSYGSSFVAMFQGQLHFGDLAMSAANIGMGVAQEQVAGIIHDDLGISDTRVFTDTEGFMGDLMNDVRHEVGAIARDAAGAAIGIVADQVQKAATDMARSAIEKAQTYVTQKAADLADARVGSAMQNLQAKVAGQATIYGAPQSSIEAAQAYVKSTFFYSIKEGDRFDGQPLPGNEAAKKQVVANRLGYYNEIISTSYGQALEASSAGYDEAVDRMEFLMGRLEAATTYDEKKAVEAAIVQNDIRERMKHLSLELSTLELESVAMLWKQPEEFLIARSPEQIMAESQAEAAKTYMQGGAQ